MILTKAKCNFLLGHYDMAIKYFDSYKESSNLSTFENDVEIIKICDEISKESQDPAMMNKLIDKLNKI